MTSASPPVFVPSPANNKLWHIPFLRVESLPEQLVKGREAAFFGYEFAVQGGNVPDEAVEYYVDLVSASGALPGSFGFYRALDATLSQNEQRKTQKLTLPVLAIGGERSYGAHVGEAMNQLAENVRSVVIPGAGHWLAEEAPEELLAALTPFLSEQRTAVPA